ncbi:MAG TPA: helix-turn-helix domain-containing protein [Thermoplasmata archaeon]|nr:helix-turn-helix domain-containing protein [Thermoplasmata archaeon]
MPKVVPGYKAEARARILDAARHLFVTRGYRRTTMEDVADALGVSKAAIYLYYRSKIDLLREIQAANRRTARAWMREALERSDPADRFSETFDDVFRKAVSREQVALYFEILGEASHDEEIRAAIRVDHREDLKSLRKFLAELRRRRVIGWDGDLDVLTFMVVALFQAAVWDLSVGFDPARTRAVLRSAMNSLLAAPAAELPGAAGRRAAR